MGIALGYIEYLILRPEPLISDLTPAQFWGPALILMISTGFLEELIFRGVFQSQAIALLGRLRGIVYVAVYFGVLHVGYHSLIDVIFVTAVGLIFGWITYKTRSIIGVTLAHGLTNIMLFLIMPFVANGRLPLPF
jgi:membrane protease YdiL (CAAX protease family)